MNEPAHAWPIRARWQRGQSRVYLRNHEFRVGVQASLRDADDAPSAIEYLLGALGGDLLAGIAAQAEKRQIEVYDMEATLSGRLDNVLVYLGVIGESGHAGLAEVDGKIYLSAETDETTVAELWRAATLRSPLYQTLSRAAAVRIAVELAH
jgi:uncharacterized OsmC-like protein